MIFGGTLYDGKHQPDGRSKKVYIFKHDSKMRKIELFKTHENMADFQYEGQSQGIPAENLVVLRSLCNEDSVSKYDWRENVLVACRVRAES